jgi:hypothetical protein
MKDFQKLQEFAALKVESDASVFLNVHNLGFRASNRFFQPYRLGTKMASRDKGLSIVDAWATPKWEKFFRKLTENKREANAFSQVVFYFGVPTQFPSVAAVQVYRRFSATSVYDPFAGWGDRLLAAMACNIGYTGVDSNVSLRVAYAEMLNFFKPGAPVKMYFQKAETLDSNKIEFDLLFSSPPFFVRKKNNTYRLNEMYNGTETDYSRFLQGLTFVVKQALDRGKRVVLHLPLNMKDDLEQVFGQAHETLEMPCGGSFRHKKKEYFYVW